MNMASRNALSALIVLLWFWVSIVHAQTGSADIPKYQALARELIENTKPAIHTGDGETVIYEE